MQAWTLRCRCRTGEKVPTSAAARSRSIHSDPLARFANRAHHTISSGHTAQTCGNVNSPTGVTANGIVTC